MQISLAIPTVLANVLFAASFALANPATLPDHPGYPMGKAIDPVRGQSLANDPGRKSAGGDEALRQSQGFGDDLYRQDLTPKQNDKHAKETTAVNNEKEMPKAKGNPK